jgi:hypothetical protein
MMLATADGCAVEFTPDRIGDSPVLPEFIEKTPQGEVIGTVTPPFHGLQANLCRATDGTYDTHRCHTAIRLLGNACLHA